jgi:hypothetical protein
MTHFANNIERIRVTHVVREARGGPYVNVRNPRAFNVERFSFPRRHDRVWRAFWRGVHRVSVGIAFTNGYPEGRVGFVCFERGR